VTDPVVQLFEEYAGRYAAGERPDLRGYLERAGEGRDELAALVSWFLQWAEAPDPDEDAVAAAQAWIEGEAPLVALRVRRGVKREEVVETLMKRFRIGEALHEKLRRRYHELETGQLDLGRVDPALLDELAALLGARVRDLLTWNPRPLAAEAAYFRVAEPLAAPPPAAAAPAPPSEPDEVDRLFLGAG
jgi:hypothetical protein